MGPRPALLIGLLISGHGISRDEKTIRCFFEKLKVPSEVKHIPMDR
jgi:hypothetical protein